MFKWRRVHTSALLSVTLCGVVGVSRPLSSCSTTESNSSEATTAVAAPDRRTHRPVHSDGLAIT